MSHRDWDAFTFMTVAHLMTVTHLMTVAHQIFEDGPVVIRKIDCVVRKGPWKSDKNSQASSLVVERRLLQLDSAKLI
jgi:hypothetical protein